MDAKLEQKALYGWDFSARFWSKVRVLSATDCWEWKARLSNGYPSISIDGRSRRASQVAWELANGRPFPEGMLACHHCDNPPCVNPDHLFVGTLADNARDMVEKGRHVLKEATHCSRGHEYTPENTRVRVRDGSARRVCKACQRRHAVDSRRAKKAALAARPGAEGGAG